MAVDTKLVSALRRKIHVPLPVQLATQVLSLQTSQFGFVTKMCKNIVLAGWHPCVWSLGPFCEHNKM